MNSVARVLPLCATKQAFGPAAVAPWLAPEPLQTEFHFRTRRQRPPSEVQHFQKTGDRRRPCRRAKHPVWKRRVPPLDPRPSSASTWPASAKPDPPQSGSAGVHLPGCPIHAAWGRAPIAGWTLLYATNCSMLDVVVIRDYRRNANTCHQSRACVVCIDVGHLLSSIEAEHDSKPRHSGPALADAAKTLDRLVGPPDVLAFGGWWGTDPGYLGLDRTAIETSAMVVDGGRMRDSASHRDAPVNRT